MRDQRTPTPAEQDDQIEQAIIGLLLEAPGPWAVEEVIREIGDEIAATDGLARLHAAGLTHRLDRFVFVTRTAARAHQLAA